jgi:hypothetical protein
MVATHKPFDKPYKFLKAYAGTEIKHQTAFQNDFNESANPRCHDDLEPDDG